MSGFLFADFGDNVYFTYQIGGTIPAPYYSTVVSQKTTQIPNLALRTSGQTWIQAWLSSTLTPSTLTITANPVGLAAGTYSGSVEVYSPNMSNTLDYVIYLTVTPAPPPLTASPSTMSFNAVQGSAPPGPQTLVIGGSLTPGAMITCSSTAPSWLNVGWISIGTAPMSIPISISTMFSALAPGTYTTSLVFEAPFTSQKVTVPISLNVSAPPPVLKTNVNSLQFQYMVGGSAPTVQAVQITSSTTQLSASVSLGASWLTAGPLSGATPFSTDIGVNTNGLAIGAYTAQVTIATNTPFEASSSTSLNVTLTITADTRPVVSSVVNSASFQSRISPGAWISIMGKNFAASTVQSSSAFIPNVLNGVTVQLSGVGGAYSLLLDYVSPTQINAFVPYEVSPMLYGPLSGATVTVSASGGTVSSSVDFEAIAPALFTYGTNNYVAAEFSDYVVVGIVPGTRPASSGSIISLYGTGFGQTSPASSSVNGTVQVRPLAMPVTVTIGSIPATVEWAGMVGVGLYQLNIDVPNIPEPGDYPVIAQVGGVASVAAMLPVR